MVDYTKTQSNPLSPKVQAERRKQILASTPAKHRYENITGSNYNWTGTVETEGEETKYLVGGKNVSKEVFNATQNELKTISSTPTIAQEQKQQRQQAVIQAVANKFSGRVQQEGKGGIEREEYYVRGREVARIQNNQLVKSEPSYFTFKQDTPTGYRTEGVAFDREGMRSARTEYTYVPQEVDLSYTVDDLIKSGGGISYTRQELADRGMVQGIGEGGAEASPQQKGIWQTEKEMGLEIGSSGVGWVSEKDIKFKTTFQQTKEIFSRINKEQFTIGVPFTPFNIPVYKVKEKIEDYSFKLGQETIPSYPLTAGDVIFKNTALVNASQRYSILNKAMQYGKGSTIRVGTALMPTTITDVTLTTIIGVGYKYAPKIIRTGISGGIATTGVIGALNPKATPEEKIASGLVGVAGGVGLVYELYPYRKKMIPWGEKTTSNKETANRLFKTEITPELEPIVRRSFYEYYTRDIKGKFKEYFRTPSNVQAIRNVVVDGKKIDVAIIQEGSGKILRNEPIVEINPSQRFAIWRATLGTRTVPLVVGKGVGKGSALRWGAFNKIFKKQGKTQYGYPEIKKQWAASSQQGFFEWDKTIGLEREMFFSPQETFIGIKGKLRGWGNPLTRYSRAGVQGWLDVPKNPETSWGLPKPSQIGFGKGLKNAKAGTTSELEIITTQEITGQKLLGFTRWKGNMVDIYQLSWGKNLPQGFSRVQKDVWTTTPKTTVSGYGKAGGLRTRVTQTKTIAITSLSLPTITSSLVSTKSSFKNLLSPTKATSRGTRASSPIVSYSYAERVSSPITTKTSYNTKQSYKNPFYYRKSYTGRTPTYTQTPTGKLLLGKLPKWKFKQKKSSNLFAVSLRRFGKFKVVGYGKTPEQAFDIGKKQATNTLGATFKLEGYQGKPFKTFGFKTKQSKQGLLYIEEPKFRLSKPTEKKEINYWKQIQRR